MSRYPYDEYCISDCLFATKVHKSISMQKLRISKILSTPDSIDVLCKQITFLHNPQNSYLLIVNDIIKYGTDFLKVLKRNVSLHSYIFKKWMPMLHVRPSSI